MKRSDFSQQSLHSLWRERVGPVWSFFCPLCSTPRKVPGSPRPTLFHGVQVGLTAIVLMLATWRWFEWKGIVSFVPIWAGFEFFFRCRIRTKAPCPKCGFDPFIFLVDEKRAKDEVENHWRKIFLEKGKPFPEKPLAKARSRSETARQMVP